MSDLFTPDRYYVPDNNVLNIYADRGLKPLSVYRQHSVREQTNKAMAHAYGWNRYGQSQPAERIFIGCFMDREDQPDWARKVARYNHEVFMDTAPYARFSEHASAIAGSGAGGRAVNWNFAMRLDAKAFTGSQDYGNCTFASTGWETMTQLLGTRILALKLPEQWIERGGTVWYCTRGHCSQGSALSQAARAWVELGVQTMQNYNTHIGRGDCDFSNENYDEKCGNGWCRRSPPDELVRFTKKNPHKTVSYFDGDWDAAKDVFRNGGVIHTGSTYTARGAGNPISRLGTVGPHAQSALGYDDTSETKDWYERSTNRSWPEEGVCIFGQTWGPNWIGMENWPAHLWGSRPDGAFVLRGRDAMYLIRDTAYVWMPDTDGYQAHPIDWTLAL